MEETERMELDCFRGLNTLLFTATQIEPNDDMVLKVMQTLAEMQAAAYESISNNDPDMSLYVYKIAQVNKKLQNGTF